MEWAHPNGIGAVIYFLPVRQPKSVKSARRTNPYSWQERYLRRAPLPPEKVTGAGAGAGRSG